ncbi:MAG: hypothetical protein RJQ14_07130, partial [Marinoscillum sp.]
MNRSAEFDQEFEKALKYANKVVFSFTDDPVEADDLVQEFSLKVLSRPEKYGDIIQHKSTVYNTLKGIYNNQRRKLKPEFRESYDSVEHIDSISLNAANEKHLESIMYSCVQTSSGEKKPLSMKEQQHILKDWKMNSRSSMKKFCSEKRISESAFICWMNGQFETEAGVPFNIQKKIFSRFNELKNTPEAQFSIKSFCNEKGLSQTALYNILRDGPKVKNQSPFTLREQQELIDEYQERKTAKINPKKKLI